MLDEYGSEVSRLCSFDLFLCLNDFRIEEGLQATKCSSTGSYSKNQPGHRQAPSFHWRFCGSRAMTGPKLAAL